MKRLITLAVGGAIGYVLGTKAGRGRYDQLVGLAKRVTKRDQPSATAWNNSDPFDTPAKATPATDSTMESFEAHLND